MQSLSGETYSKRPVPPPGPDIKRWTERIAAFLGNEFGNIQRALGRATSRTVTSDVTATTADGLILIDATTGNVSVTLPDPNSVAGMVLSVKRIDGSGNTATIVGTVDGAANPTLATQYASKTIWAHVPSAGNGAWFTTAEV